MPTSRRTFLQRSAAAAAAATLSPVAAHAAARKTAEAASAAAADTPAQIRAFEARLLRARPVPLARVRLTGGPLKHAQEMNGAYLLALDPDRMMAYYRLRAGLPKKAEGYTGWDGDKRNLTGHIAGHHLSGVSLMYAATGDTRYKTRADYLVRELKEVQDKNGDGYLGALDGGREAFAAVSKGDIRSGGFDLNGLWSPWYTLHKTFAGLRDAYRHTGNAAALEVEIKYATWAESVLAPMSDAQVQKMLLTEHGGMNEVLADLYADTGDTRWLDLSLRFEHRAFTDALKRHQDNLDGKHGNCQIPKLIGSAARYGYTGDSADIEAASFFWDRVVQHHTYATGGHGLSEYFGEPDKLSNRVDGRACETCNDYNMLKLTRRLFGFRPDAFYADFHERALFNHILASMDPEDGRTSYMVPVGRGVQQEYQDMQRDFTCCVGSGMESHALHGDGIFYESANAVWVNIYAPSTAQLTLGNATLTMDSGFPDGDSATLRISLPSPKEFTLHVRRPSWAGDAFAVKVNGTAVPVPPIATLRPGAAGGRALGNEENAPVAGSYVDITRSWKSGDVVEIAIPKSVHLEPTPDNASVAAIMWGPLVLAGNHGPRREGRASRTAEAPIPVLVAAERPLTEWVVAGARAGDFTAKQVGRIAGKPSEGPLDVSLTPFWRTHRRVYSAYFDILTPQEFDARGAAIAAETERKKKLEAATVAMVQPGEMQPERDFNYQSEPADRPAARTNGRGNRGGAGWFSFDIPVDAASENAVVVTYFNEVGLPPQLGNFEIQIDGTRIAKYEPIRNGSGFVDGRYAIPAALVRGKSKVTVRFQAATNSRVVPIYGVRMVRADKL
jgi:DUF1680 family protein